MRLRRFLVMTLLAGCLPEGPAVAPGSNIRVAPAPPSTVPARDAGPRLSDDAGPPVQLLEINPNSGPSVGGTRVQLRGEGLAADSQVLIGGQPVLDMLLRNQRIITFRTPPGRPGPASIRVTNSLGEASLEDGFTYFDALDLHGIEPPTGPRAGGIAVTVRGEGFDAQTAVLVGGRSVVAMELISSQEIKGYLPPASSAGWADLEVVKAYGSRRMAQAFQYRADLTASALEPSEVAPGELAQLEISGRGFSADLGIRIGEQECVQVEVVSDALARCTLPGRDELGSYPLELLQGSQRARLPAAFRRLAPGGRNLQAIAPDRGRPSGGEGVMIYGSGLDQGLAWIRLGEELVPLLEAQPERVAGIAPAQAAGRVDLTAAWRDGHRSVLPQAYDYRPDLVFDRLEPHRGTAEGGEEVTVFGAGFCEGVQVFLAGRPQELLVQEAGQLTFRTSSGPGGPAELRLVCEEQQRVLPDAYFFEAPLHIHGLHPRRGAVAGGTLVSLAGTGFSDLSLEIRFGDQVIHDFERLSDQVLRFRTPPAAAGWIDLSLRRAQEEVALVEAFEYYDPGFRYGGTRGGAARGAVNVTVLNTYTNLGPVEGANVALDSEGSAARTALTNAAGQVTFSELELRGPQTVTAFKLGCLRAVSVVEVEASDITLWMACPPPPDTPGGGGAGQPPSQPSRLAGRVRGFSKSLFDPAVLGPGERAMAQLYLTQRTVDGGRPWLGGADRIWSEGERFVVTVAPGRYTLIAIAGIWSDQEGRMVRELQLGMHRNISALSGEYHDGIDIDLAYGMDRNVLVQFTAEAEPLPDQVGPNHYQVSTVLDLGGDGFFPLQTVTQERAPVLLRGLPQAPGELFRFIGGLVTGETGISPSSVVRVRGGGNLNGGITLGPLLPFPDFLAPATNGEVLEGGLLRWKLPEFGQRPDYIELDMTGPSGQQWNLLVPGDQRKVRIPRLQAVVGQAPDEPGHYQVSVSLISAPGFDLDNFNYLETWTRNRRAFSRSRVSFRLP